MSDNLNVRATLSAIDHASPVIAKLLANVKQLESIARRFSASFAGIGNTKMFNGLSAQLKRATDEVARSADKYKADWDRAYSARMSEAGRMHSELARLERRNTALQIQNQRGVAQAYRSPSARSGSLPRGISPTSAALASGGLFAGVAAAFRARMIADAAETKAQIFGGLSKDQIKAFRSDIGDKLTLKFGQSASTVVHTLTESLKAGFNKDIAEKLVNGILESAAGLELDTKALTALAGKVATSIYGNAAKADPARVLAMMNSVAVAAAETAADSNEIVEANKRALSILSVTKMNERDLSAFTGVGISAGLMPFKVGSLMDYLGNTIANAGNERGKRAEDLDSAAKMIGAGGRKAMAQKVIAAPTQFLVDMFEKMQNMSEEQRAKFANLVGKREWGGELIQLAKAADQIREVLKNIQEKSDALGKYSATKLNSLQARWASIKTAFSIAWEKFGEGFEETFIQVSDWFKANANSFAFAKIKEKSKQLVDGLKKGFGIANISDSLDNLVSRIQRTDATKAVEFIRGFAEGLGSVFETARSALKRLASIFGDGDSARGIGKFTAHLFGLMIALRFLAPVVSVLGSLGTGFMKLVSGLRSLGSMVGAGSIGSLLAGSFKTLGKGIAGGLVMKVGEILLDILFAAADWVLGKIGINRNSMIDTDRLAERGLWQKLKDSFLSNEEFKRKYEKRSDVGKAIGEEIKKSSLLGNNNPFAGNIQLASFISGTGGGFSYASLGRGINLKGTPLHHAVPGHKLPSFGLGSNGIIRRDKIPSFNGGGGSVANPGSAPSFGVNPSVGAGLSGNAYLASRRARFKGELDENPELKKRLAALIDLENPGAGTAVAESLMNRMDMNGRTIASGIGGGSRSFYGPVRRGIVEPRLRELERNPARMAARMRQIDEALAGSNLIEGHTDQGSAGDPNYIAGGVGININRERFNDWGGGRYKGLRGHAASRAYRHDLMRGVEQGVPISGVPAPSSSNELIRNVPSPSSLIQNVPPPIRGDASLGPGRGTMGANGGPVNIHINGNSHDPEALATLVQRRIDESINWRTHDTASEYT